MDIREIRRENLRRLVEKFGTKAKFGRHYDVDATYLSQILNGHRNLGEKAARKLEKSLNLNEFELDKLEGDDADISATTFGIPDVSGVRVPLLSAAEASDWVPSDPAKVREWFETVAKVGKKSFAIQVVGDSMTSPSGLSIPDGAFVVVDSEAGVQHGSIVLAKLEGSSDATLKRLVIDGPNRYLKPLNPAYSPIPINGNCRIIGVAKKVEFDL